MKKTDVIYKDICEAIFWEYDDFISNGKTVEDWEDEQIEFCGYTFAIYEVDRLMTFVAMGYIEVINNTLTDRMRHELELDISVWDSGKVDKFLSKEDKEQLYPHLQIIKDYINKTNQDN